MRDCGENGHPIAARCFALYLANPPTACRWLKGHSDLAAFAFCEAPWFLFRFGVLRGLRLQGSSNPFWVAGDYRQVSPRRLIGFRAALFPIAQRAGRDMIAGCKFLLCKAKDTAQSFRAGYTRRAVRHSSVGIVRASGSATAAAWISSSVIGHMGASGKGRSSPFSKAAGLTPSTMATRYMMPVLLFKYLYEFSGLAEGAGYLIH